LRGLIVLDEVQLSPGLFSTPRVLADRPRKPARFLVLGSASPELLRQGSETLAGGSRFTTERRALAAVDVLTALAPLAPRAQPSRGGAESVRPPGGNVTAFTLAHSITLALAALSVVTPSPRLVEPAIALSIAYVGVENLFVRDASKRWRITFPFGLIHGFGFAGALREIALPRAQTECGHRARRSRAVRGARARAVKLTSTAHVGRGPDVAWSARLKCTILRAHGARGFTSVLLLGRSRQRQLRYVGKRAE
jgi:hypothetical protein